MDRIFLTIARVTLIAVIALSLLLSAITAIYGSTQFFLTEQPKAPQIVISLKDMAAQNASAASGAETAAQTEPNSDKAQGTTKHCDSSAQKMNQIARKIGWDKKQEHVFDPNMSQYGTTESIDYGSNVDAGKLCEVAQSIIEAQNTKLAPYIRQVDLKETYFGSLDSFLNEVALDSNRDLALPINNTSKYYTVTAFEWFNKQFIKAVDDAKDAAIQKEAESTVKRAKGTAALYAAGIAFVFFFTCCLTLVFIRIEVNTKELVEVIRAFENKAREAPTAAINPK